MISFLSESWFPKKQNSDFHTPDRWWISPRIIQIEKAEDGQPRLYLDLKHFPDSSQLSDMMMDWMDKAEALESKQITQDEYDQWRYHYPVVGQTTHTHFAKVIPQELSDMLIAKGKKIDQSENKKK